MTMIIYRTRPSRLAARNIRVNVVAPGWTQTPLGKRGPRANAFAGEAARITGFSSSTIRPNRWGELEEIAGAVPFLASNDFSYINAVELAVDGGETGAPFGAPMLRC
jgi:NAD(P)-dependent dehydrogenase (short-subunit alcohol dehydrogenase family)